MWLSGDYSYSITKKAPSPLSDYNVDIVPFKQHSSQFNDKNPQVSAANMLPGFKINYENGIKEPHGVFLDDPSQSDLLT